MVSYATPQYNAAIRSLWKDVFGDSDAFLDLYFHSIYKTNQCVVCVEEDALCAVLQLLPYRFQNNQKSYNALYIFAVMTAPHKRNKGYMRKLLDFVFDELATKNIDFVFLIPQHQELVGMYEKFGFKPAFVQSKVVIELPSAIQQAFVPDIDDAYDFYLLANKKSTQIIQSRVQFEFMVQTLRVDGGELLGVKTANKLEALCFSYPSEYSLRVLDLISINNASEQKLLAALKTKYNVSKALVSSSSQINSSYIGMAKILQPNKIQWQDIEKAYLSLMMNE